MDEPCFRSICTPIENQGMEENQMDALPTVPTSICPARSKESECQKIRNKQQRLLLLRHANRCQHEIGTCPVTPHCANMKKHWEHIAHCRNQQCKEQHCLSSRYVLSHYRRCKNSRCPSCGPVRDSIRSSTQREKRRLQRQAVKDSGMPLSSSGMSLPLHQDSGNLSEFFETGLPSSELELDVLSSPIVASPMSCQVAQTAVVPAAASSNGKTIEAPKQHADHSLLDSLALQELETHLASMNLNAQFHPDNLKAANLKAKCLEILQGLLSYSHGWVFNGPVDPVELGIPDYFDVIKIPMDLGSILKKLESGAYNALKDFEADTHLTFDNAMAYQEAGSVIWAMARELKTKFEADMKQLMAQLVEMQL